MPPQPFADLTQLLKRHLMLISKNTDCAQPDDIAEGIDPAERTAPVVVRVRGGKEPRLVPVPELSFGETGQLANMVYAEG